MDIVIGLSWLAGICLYLFLILQLVVELTHRNRLSLHAILAFTVFLVLAPLVLLANL